MPEYCACLEECNNEVVYNKVIERLPFRLFLSSFTASEAHSIAYILKGVNKRMEQLDIREIKNVLPIYNAIAEMPGTVSVTT